MFNQSTVAKLLLLGFSDTQELQISHFLLFLGIYQAAMMGDFLIIVVIVASNHLHTPMYFFLLNLSILDFSTISVTLPKSMANFLWKTTSISCVSCVSKVFFFHVFCAAELALLTVMAYDGYIAICRPLYYKTIMKGSTCILLAASAWLSYVPYSALHTGNIFSLTFCKSNIIEQFFCEVPQLLKLSCSHSYFSELGPVSNSPSALDLTVSLCYSVLPPVINPVIYTVRNNDTKAAMQKLTGCRLLYRNK
ncbi:LOW QUALITY PROTEIN: olfactory receptor 14J1-like [Myiozetetes cayanensis]|uniref:LOW QUALITY PROTEIN: olfactory receptor 14J1-like n=1 Tax=Myiozetetes cayanensis TaxID=478635 RepID=UPI00215DD861|nr:LOW QUALITY PROTEIN: olfactory receptor 14J1-like [Myiozetetes cayanensis]